VNKYDTWEPLLYKSSLWLSLKATTIK